MSSFCSELFGKAVKSSQFSRPHTKCSGVVAAFDDTPLYFRGAAIVDAVLDDLHSHYGLKDAKKVILSGGSAGALGAMIQADHVAKRLGNGVDFGVLAVSGFFLDEKR